MNLDNFVCNIKNIDFLFKMAQTDQTNKIDADNIMPGNQIISPHLLHALKKIELQRQIVGSPQVRRKIRALRKLQLNTTLLEAEFHQNVYELECKFADKHTDIFKKRMEIISGEYEPTEDECDFPDANYSVGSFQDVNENSPPSIYELNSKGIPDFWLTILKFVPLFDSFVKEADEPALKHLTDIRVVSKPHPDLSFVLEFVFSPNDYFTNPVLTKVYKLKCAPDEDDPFSFDGLEIYKCEGCKINWIEGKNLTTKTIKRKNQGNTNGNYKVVKTDSFFNFFDPPILPDDENDPLFDDINAILETDFEIAHFLKERVVPRAVLYFTGECDDFSENTSDNGESEDCDISDEDIHEGSGNIADGEGDV